MKKVKVKIECCSKIYKYNFDGMCSEETCSNRYDSVAKLHFKGRVYLIPLCKEHHEKLVNDIDYD